MFGGRSFHRRFFFVVVLCGSEDDGDQLSKGYDYLLGMKLWNLTLEKVRQMENELEAKTKEMGLLKVSGKFIFFCLHYALGLGKKGVLWRQPRNLLHALMSYFSRFGRGDWDAALPTLTMTTLCILI